MLTTDFLVDSAIRFMRKADKESGVQAPASPENRVAAVGKAAAFQIGLSAEMSLDVFIIDISELIIGGGGFKILMPMPNFHIPEESGDVALFVNKLNSRGGRVGKFVIHQDLTLNFALETVVSEEGDPDPNVVEVALLSALDAVMELCGTFEEAAGQNAGAGRDTGDILNPA